MLSGFVLQYSCQDQPTGRFYRNRVARIYPTHLLTLGLFLLPQLLRGALHDSPLQLVSNALLLHAWVPDQAYFFSGNPVSWSISVEFFFYALFPLLLLLKGWQRRGLLLLLITGMLAGLHLFPSPQYHSLYYIHPLFRLPDFLIGMELCLLFKKRNEQGDYSGLQWAALLFFVLAYAFANHIPMVYRYGMYYWLPVALLIYAFSLPGFWHRVLSRRWLVWLGEVSFAFYMIHLLVIRVVERLPFPTFVESALALGLSILAAACIRHFYEQPLNRWIRSGSAKRQG